MKDLQGKNPTVKIHMVKGDTRPFKEQLKKSWLIGAKGSKAQGSGSTYDDALDNLTSNMLESGELSKGPVNFES